MLLAAGTRLGPYTIVTPIGAGGMGEVYRARDTRLDRTVAIKVLPSTDEELRQRFAREARAIASLTHPHVCTLFDVGHEDGTDFLVMEYLEGQTLASRLEGGPLDLQEALRHGIAIARALDAAHRAGIVHRDLKPGNIMLTRSGAKLLDFGLAKLRARALDTAMPLAATVTGTPPLTASGIIVGTPRYMAPEQLEGKEADARTDLFALGVVLYEMVTGRPAFQGSTPASLIAAIMTSDPPPVPLQQVSPPAFAELVRTCLIKDPEERRQSAHDVRLELEWIASGPQMQAPSGPRHQRLWLLMAGALALAVALGVSAAMWYPRREGPAPVFRAALPLEDHGPHAPILSPDGRRLAFTGREDENSQWRLWIHSLESSRSDPMPGTDGAMQPFWSPDGRFVGFFADRKLKIVSADPGALAVRAIADAPEPRGGTWSPDGTIFFARNIEDGIYRVDAAGGEVRTVTVLDRDKRQNSHRWPQILPDGRGLLYLARSALAEHQGLYAGTPDSNDWKLVVRTPFAGQVTVAHPGGWPRPNTSHLLYIRETTLMAQRFDLDQLELRGQPVPLAHSVATYVNRGVFTAAGDVLAYSVGSQPRPAWFDRKGEFLQTMTSPTASHPSLSKDARFIAFDRIDAASGAGDIWLEDRARGVTTRLTSHPGFDWIPIWSPDGSRIAFASNREGTMDLYIKPVDGSEPERLLLKSDERKVPTGWSGDGAVLLFEQETVTNGWDIWALPMNGSGQPFPVLQSEFNETQAVLSPDGLWLAYTSDETGEPQIYLKGFPEGIAAGALGTQRPERVSPRGGVQPQWRVDGRALFYIAGDQRLMAVSVGTGTANPLALPTPLFATGLGGPTETNYAVTPDGERFLLAKSGSERPAPLQLILNWSAGLQ
ncbi:MAG TPA: protein kinase [Vicinamibacterales bacterium]|nr:protein kinase [Vicinamibacterales bacterium]